MDIVILAGGRCDPDLAEFSGTEWRADLPFGGRSMLDIVVSAVSGFGDPIVVGAAGDPIVRHVPAGAHFIESLSNGIGAVTTPEFLLATADLPCLTAEAVQDFLDRCDPQAGFNYPVITVDDCESAFPGMRRTSLRLREGEFTGGNIALMQTDSMRRALPTMQEAYANRKKPLKLAAMVGLDTLFRVAVGRVAPASLPLATLEAKVSRFLGVRIKAVVSRYAEIGADIDNLAQYKSLIALKNPT